MKPAWSPPEQAASYVSRVAANLFYDEVRRRKVRAAHVPEAELTSELIEEITPERELIARENLQRLFERLQRLGDRTHEIFLNHRLDEIRQVDIATSLGVCVSTVEKHISKAFLHLDEFRI